MMVTLAKVVARKKKDMNEFWKERQHLWMDFKKRMREREGPKTTLRSLA